MRLAPRLPHRVTRLSRRVLRREKSVLALVLAAVAGFVDAVGFLILHQLFTAHMSGNTATMGARLGRGDLAAAAPLAAAVGLFVFGIALGAVASEVATRRGARSVAAGVLGVEWLLIAAFMGYGLTVVRHHTVRGTGAPFYVLAALAIVGMGLQTTTLQSVSGRTVRTTYISGVLTGFSEELVNWLFWVRDGEHRPHPSYLGDTAGLGDRREASARARLLGSVWCCYLGGGVLGSVTELHWGLAGMAIPLATLLAVIAADVLRPFNVAPGRHRRRRRGSDVPAPTPRSGSEH